MSKREQFYDAAGRPVSRVEALDENGLLRSGFGMRTPMFALDSVQRELADRKKAAARREEEPDEDDNDGRPVTADAADYFTDARGITYYDARISQIRRVLDYLRGRDEALRQQWRDGRAAAEQARQQAMRDAESAWRRDQGYTGTDPRSTGYGSQPASGAAPAGAYARPTFDAVEGARRKREAYDAMCQDMANA